MAAPRWRCAARLAGEAYARTAAYDAAIAAWFAGAETIVPRRA